MINNEMKQVQLLSYSSETDDYAQQRKSTPTSINIEMMIKTYQQTNTGDMRFLDVELIGLTKYKNITVNNEVSYNNQCCQILHIVNTPRYTVVYMKVKH